MMPIDFGILVVGTVLGMLIGGSIILFLVFAAVSSAKDTRDHVATKSSLSSLHSARYERAHLRTALGHDPEDW
jgi:hypothetical protein